MDNTNGSVNPSACIFMKIRRNGSYTVSYGLEYVGPELHMAGSSVTLVSTLHPEDEETCVSASCHQLNVQKCDIGKGTSVE